MKIDNLAEKSSNPSDAFLSMFNIKNTQKSDGLSLKIPIDNLVPFPDHATFRQYDDEKLNELADNIRIYGVLSPIIVRPLASGKYQILAGHNRTAAAKMAGLSEIPAIVKDVDEDTAKVIFVATNLNQRERLLPSEKAYAYKILLEVSKCHYDTAGEIGSSKSQIFRYVRLTHLIKPLLSMVDNGDIIFMAGVNISYLDAENQQILFEYLKKRKIKVTLAQSERIRHVCESSVLTDDMIDTVFKKAKAPKKSLKLPMREIRSYFGNMKDKEIIERIIELIKLHPDELK